MTRRRAAMGFTLLEVMVAVAILGLGLTAILSAQAGVFASSAHARNLGIATGLARCKMSELEEHLARDGFQELDEIESGPCCDGDETPGMRCSWKIEKPELPEPKYGELDLDTDLDLGGQLGALGLLATGSQGPSALDGIDGISGLAETLAGASAEGGPAGAAGGIASFVMNLVYPDLKTLFDASSRRVTVTVAWMEGTNERTIEIQQWVTSPQAGGMTGVVPELEDPSEQETSSTTGSSRSTGGDSKTSTPTKPTTGRMSP